MPYWRYVRPDENWAAVGAWTASTSQTNYAPTNVINNDPTKPWWSTSGTSSLHVELTSPAVDVDIIAFIHNNGDAGEAIVISGDLTGSVTCARQGSGYPKNVAHYPVAGATAQSLTFTITGNSVNWAVGEMVIGTLRSFSDSLLVEPVPVFDRIRHVIKDIDEDYEHEIRTDLGSERWRARGRMYHDDAALDDFVAWWESTKGGSLPTLIVPDDHDEEVRLVRLDSSIAHERMYDDLNWFSLTFEECSRGILVQ